MYWSVVWCSGGCSWKCYKILTFCSLLTRCTIPCACHAKRHLNLQKWSEPLVVLTFWLRNVLRATTARTFSRSELPKVVRAPSVLYILTSKCASCHNGVHFFVPQRRALFRHLNCQKWSAPLVLCTFWFPNVLRATSTSKSGPNVVCFVHFDLNMCFAPQRRALFRHLNFQKCSETQGFCTFSLWNVLRATTACNFSSLIWPAGSAPAALASLLFDSTEPQINGKTPSFATFPPFRASASFFWLFLFYASLF